MYANIYKVSSKIFYYNVGIYHNLGMYNNQGIYSNHGDHKMVIQNNPSPLNQDRSTPIATRRRIPRNTTLAHVTRSHNHGLFMFFLALIGILSLAGTVSADLTQVNSPITGKVFVASATYDPAVFFTGDKGTVTYVVTNANDNTSVMLNHGTFNGDRIRLVSGTYDYSNTLGPLQTRAFVFSVLADAPTGDYYPTFSLSFYDANLYHKSLVQVDNTPLVLTVLDKPDTFTPDKKDQITVQIANPRKNNVKNVILDVSGDGIVATPSEKFIGALTSGNATNVTFAITPAKETTLNLTVKYNNGDNLHAVDLAIPVSFGTDKKKAAPQMSNVVVKYESGVYHITGDITNAGLTTANGVSVTTLSPAMPEDPYKSYVIGALKADDFGSFEVTFTADNATSVPVQVSYKDADGNIITSREDVSIGGVTSTDTENQQGTGGLLLPIIVVAVLAIGGWYYYNRRKQNQ
jgi:hypothetical protein